MSMTSMPGNQSGGMGGKSMGGPNTTGPGGYGNNYDGNPNSGGMPTQFGVGGPGMGIGKGIGMDYRNLGGGPGMGNQPPGLPSTGMGGGKGMGPVGGMLPGIIGGQMPPGGGQLVGGAYGRPILGSGTQPIDGSTSLGVEPVGYQGDVSNAALPFNFSGEDGNYTPPPTPSMPTPPGGGQLVGGAYGKPIFGGNLTPNYSPAFTNEQLRNIGNPQPQPAPVDKFIFGGGQQQLNRRGAFFDSPEYQNFNNNGVGIDTMDIYTSPYFGQNGGSARGGAQDRAYEAYLQRTGQQAGYGINKNYNMFDDFFGRSPPTPSMPTPPGGGQQQPITNQPGGPRNNRFAPPNAPGVRRAPAAAVSRTNVQSPARVAKPITRTRSR